MTSHHGDTEVTDLHRDLYFKKFTNSSLTANTFE